MAKKDTRRKNWRPDGSVVGTPSSSQNPDKKAIRRSYMDRTSTYGGNNYATGDALVEKNRILEAKKMMKNMAKGRDIPLPPTK